MEDSSKKKKNCFLRFLGSYVGLFILMTLYMLGFAYIFYDQQSKIELRQFDELTQSHEEVSKGIHYLADFFTDLHYSPLHTINNCSSLVEDPCYRDLATQGYFAGCGNECDKSQFCKCIREYEKQFELTATASIYKLAEHVVRVSEAYNYELDENNQIVWSPSWTFPNALLFTMTTLTFIGYGHISPVNVSGQIQCVILTIIGIPIVMLFLANIGGAMADALKYSYSRLCCRWCRIRRKWSEKKGDISLKEDNIGSEPFMPTNDVAVPIILALCLMMIYIVIGAMVYSAWEGWTLLDGVYFCFVTLTTIGFGDFVPGQSSNPEESELSEVFKLFFTSMYCLFGLALISMGISLMQEQVLAKVKWLAEETGMKGNEDDNIEKYILKKFPNARISEPMPVGKKAKSYIEIQL